MADAMLSVEVVAELNSLTTGLDKATKEINKFVSTSVPGIENLQRVLNSLGVNTSLQGLTTATNAATQALQNQRVETERSRTSTQDQRTATEAQRTETTRLRAELAALRLANAQNRASTVAASGSYAEAQQRLTQLGQQIRNVSGGFRSQSPLVQARIREYNQLNTQLRQFDATLGNHQRNVGNYGGALRGAGSDLAGLVSGYLSAGAALQYVLKSSMEFQRIKTPLTYILGSEGDANNKLNELKDLAGQLGLEYFALAASYKSFSAAARASNFDLVQSEKIFASVTKASAVLGLSSEQLSGSLLAIQQMISKGNVQAEELRGQLAERLPGAFALSAKAMGVTEQELNKLLKSGDVLAKDLLPKLAAELDKQYGDKAAEGIKGLNAEWQRFVTSLQGTAGESSVLSTKIFEPILRGAKAVIDILNNSLRGSFTENFRYIFSLFNSTRRELLSLYELRDSNKNNKSALQGARDRDLTGAGLGELKTFYTQTDQNFKNAVKSYEEYKKSIADGSKKETATESLASYARTVEGFATERNRVAIEIVKQKKQIQQANKELKEVALTSVTDIRKEIARLSKLDGSALIGSDVYKQIEGLKERLAKPKAAANVKDISDVLKDLKIDLVQAENQFGATFGEIATKKISEYQKAINELIKLGYDPAKKSIQDLKDAQQGLFQLPTAKPVQIPIEKPKPITALQGGDGLGVEFNEKLANAMKRIVEFTDSINEIISNSIGGTLGDIGTEVGKMFSGEGGNIGDAILSGMKSFLNAFGDQLIQFGLAAEAFAALQLAVFAGGPLGIGAAVAVIAAGVALKAIASSVGPNTRQSSSGRVNNAEYGVPHFANGGIVSGPTLAMVGEYPGAKSDPEVISPLSKLKSMIGDRGGSQTQVMIPEVRLSGQDIYIAFKRTEKNNRRMT